MNSNTVEEKASVLDKVLRKNSGVKSNSNHVKV